MRIATWSKHPGDLLGETIDFFTHGPAQHAGFVRLNGMIHEAYLPQVRDRAPVAGELQYVQTFRILGLPLSYDDLFEKQFDRALAGAVKYSIGDLFRFLFNVPNVDESHTFCSRYVMHTIMQICPQSYWPQVRCMAGDWISPRDLYISNLLIPAEPLQLLP
jgi:hypothetical protein